MTTKFPKALAAAGLAAVLVGCGGGSETVPMETGEPDAATLMMQRQDSQRMAINDAITAFNTALAKVNNESPDSDVTDAETALAEILMKINAAADLPDAEKNAHMTTYNNGKTSLDGAKQRRTAHMEAEAEKMKMEQAAAAKKARDDAAKLWVAAITDYKVGTTVTDFDALKDEITNLDIESKDGTTTIELSNQRGVKITNVADTASPATGWTAKRFTKTADKSRGVIITSLGGSSDKLNRYSYANFFFTAYDGTADGSTAKENPISGVTGITVNDAAAANLGQVTFTNAAMLKDSYFGGKRPGPLNADGKQDVIFLGVEGELSCESACTIGATDSNKTDFQFSTDAIFTPEVPRGDDLNDVIVSLLEVPDNTKYLSFGYWLVTTDDPKHTIHTFAQGHDYGDDNNGLHSTPNELRGKATYSGGAAGVYVLKTGNLADNPDLHDGEFVADVELTAQFGNSDNTIAAADQWKIEGNIDDFRSSTNTAHNLSGWNLGLSADFGTRNASDADTAQNTVPDANLTTAGFMAVKGSTNPVTNALRAGTLAASFYGNAGAATTTGDAPNADDHPEAVVGEFDGHFVNGHVVGAFGAVKD